MGFQISRKLAEEHYPGYGIFIGCIDNISALGGKKLSTNKAFSQYPEPLVDIRYGLVPESTARGVKKRNWKEKC